MSKTAQLAVAATTSASAVEAWQLIHGDTYFPASALYRAAGADLTTICERMEEAAGSVGEALLALDVCLEVVEEQGKTLPKRPPLVLVKELQARLDADPDLKAAFESLTPGRRREYNLFVSGAKQAKTRVSRVEKHLDRILAGKGLRDR